MLSGIEELVRVKPLIPKTILALITNAFQWEPVNPGASAHALQQLLCKEGDVV